MRWQARLVALLALCVLLFAALTLWSRCRAPGTGPAAPPPSSTQVYSAPSGSGGLSDIRCIINDEYSVDCKRSGKTVYLPFSFIKKYFEVYGEVTEERDKEVFRWSHSYGKVFPPEKPYRPEGVFMYFGTYNVEKRDRVKCISGPEGVPVTSQWLPSGFFYPVQIAQFGLSHYSRNLTEPPPKQLLLVSPEKLPGAGQSGARREVVYDTHLQKNVVRFSAHAGDELRVPVDSVGLPILTFDLSVSGNVTISVDLTFGGAASVRSVRVHYICSDTDIFSTCTC